MRRGRGGQGPQGAFIAQLMRSEFPDRFHELIFRRLKTWFPPEPLSLAAVETRWLTLRQVLSRSRPCKVWSPFKTLAGGWITSHRVKILTPLPCRFGCPGHPDSFLRYLSCPRLLHLIALPRLHIPTVPPFLWLSLGTEEEYDGTDLTIETAHDLVSLAYFIFHKIRAELAVTPSQFGSYVHHLSIRHAALVRR